MILRFIYCFFALFAGLLLSLMIHFNSMLAKFTSPLFASFMTHGVGAIVALLFVVLFSKSFFQKAGISHSSESSPFWVYLGGVLGSVVVFLAVITVNSDLGFSGSLAFMLAGQVLFGVVLDYFGLFGIKKRKLIIMDYLAVIFIIAGSALIIHFKE